jgi:hypothetical protein
VARDHFMHATRRPLGAIEAAFDLADLVGD